MGLLTHGARTGTPPCHTGGTRPWRAVLPSEATVALGRHRHPSGERAAGRRVTWVDAVPGRSEALGVRADRPALAASQLLSRASGGAGRAPRRGREASRSGLLSRSPWTPTSLMVEPSAVRPTSNTILPVTPRSQQETDAPFHHFCSTVQGALAGAAPRQRQQAGTPNREGHELCAQRTRSHTWKTLETARAHTHTQKTATVRTNKRIQRICRGYRISTQKSVRLLHTVRKGT